MCMLFGLPGFIQEAALTALLGSDAPEQRIRELCTSRRDMLIEGLAGLRGIRCAVPDAGMFMLVDVRGTGLSGYDFMCELYRTERVSVLDGGAFGGETSGFVRVCFATDAAWLPGPQEETFHRPAELQLDDLPAGFQRDEGLAAALGMIQASVEAASRQLGIPADVLRGLGQHPDLVELVERELKNRGFDGHR